MSLPRLSIVLIILFGSTAADAKAVESIQFIVGSEVRIADGSELLYLENVTQLNKSWATFDRDVHSVFAGTELLLEPVEFGDRTKLGFDTVAAIVGYKFTTYDPDWYNFGVKLRVPLTAPGDPFDRPVCRATPVPSCTDERSYGDRLQLVVDPLFFKKTWNLFAIQDRNRVTLDLGSIEYGNKVRFLDLSPDLDFPIALYVGNDVRLKVDFETGFSGRARDDIFVGIASNVYDWLHVAVDVMVHFDTKEELNQSFVSQVYLEFYFDVLFDNTVERAPRRGAQDDSRSS
ncbi:MAG: hypothetical protein HY791_18020 [Deltaproteobacteria bacterium]|nr:hypothetical protein [Deltaproteobacteria bacterium]